MLEDLGGQFRAEELQNQQLMAWELAQGEAAEVTLVGRIFASTGRRISVVLCDNSVLDVTICEVGSDWFLSKNAGSSFLIFNKSIQSVQGLNTQPAWACETEKRLTARSVLRRWWQQQIHLSVVGHAGAYSGRLLRVGKDFIDLSNGTDCFDQMDSVCGIYNKENLETTGRNGLTGTSGSICLPLNQLWYLRAWHG